MFKQTLSSQDLFFTSDHHIGHRNILKYQDRRFSSIEEHDETLIKAWNDIVRGGTVIHLGDFSFKPEAFRSILPRLNGKVVLFRGNHDPKASRIEQQLHEYGEITVNITGTKEAQRIVLCHYPFYRWNRCHYGAWHFHGHTHGTLPCMEGLLRVDIGVDMAYELTGEYRPFSFSELQALMENLK